ncbi:MAG: ATP-binding protein [Patescibacteria group bacterium]
MNYVQRKLESQIVNKMFHNNIIVLYGPRQAGKTTLVKKILTSFAEKGLYWNCEDPEIFSILASFKIDAIFEYFKDKKVVVFDEAQRIPNIGLLLKLLFDTYPQIQYIATGSSSFELSQQVGEPLVGRSWEFVLYPFGITEIATDIISRKKILPTTLVYGLYPEIWKLNNEEKEQKLKIIANQFLAKDLLIFEGIRNAVVLNDILRLLAGQIGNEVSYNEIATLLGISRQTVQRYIDILEKSFVIFRLYSYRRNIRGRVGRKFKVYFNDLGIRNALINQFASIDLNLRQDSGHLWENFCILERKKINSYTNKQPSTFFWRGDSSEVDYLEEEKGEIMAYECKLNVNARISSVNAFKKEVKPKILELINPETIENFLK